LTVLITEHLPDCPLGSALGPVAIECIHGYDVCPQCDPCRCDGTTKYAIETWQTERGWSARESFTRLEAVGGLSEQHAFNEVAGALLIALGHRRHPPTRIALVTVRLGSDPESNQTKEP